MSRALLALALAAIAAGAFLLRETHRDAFRVPAGEAGGTSRWLVDDPDAAYHLRRVEVALVTGRIPLRDRYLNHPAGSPVPWPPLLDAALARGARLWLDAGAADRGPQGLLHLIPNSKKP